MSDALRQFARQGRSFHFATRFLPASQRDRIASVYAYCRSTDDLVDEARGASIAELHARLDEWRSLSRAAYDGRPSGVDVIDVAMSDMRAEGIPFRYADDLMAGMRMDIEPRPYHDFADLQTYTYRVAGVVGLWVTGLFGVRESWMLERAVCLGRAMQLTNIVRDVGEDLDRGRVYLPESVMRSYGLTLGDLRDMRSRRRGISPAYRAALEAVMTTADAEYARAFEAIPHLPASFSRTVAVAAEVYRGIHAEVRAAGYDSITRRAVTTLPRKCVLAMDGLRRSYIAGRTAPVRRPLVDAA